MKAAWWAVAAVCAVIIPVFGLMVGFWVLGRKGMGPESHRKVIYFGLFIVGLVVWVLVFITMDSAYTGGGPAVGGASGQPAYKNSFDEWCGNTYVAMNEPLPPGSFGRTMSYENHQKYTYECHSMGRPGDWIHAAKAELTAIEWEHARKQAADDEISRQWHCIHKSVMIGMNPEGWKTYIGLDKDWFESSCSDGPDGWTDARPLMCRDIAHDANNIYRHGTYEEAFMTLDAWEPRVLGSAGLDNPITKAFLGWHGDNCR